jgi:RNA recognition motif-containing protein
MRSTGEVMKRIYVGNLAFSATEGELRGMFEAHGPVESVSIITEPDTGRSRGFAFVEMPNDADAEKAITALGGSDVGGRPLTVNEARPRQERGGGGGRGGRDGGGQKSGGRERRW